MKVELHSSEHCEKEVIEGVLNYEYDETFSLLFLYDVKDIKGVDPIAVVIVNQWALIKFK